MPELPFALAFQGTSTDHQAWQTIQVLTGIMVPCWVEFQSHTFGPGQVRLVQRGAELLLLENTDVGPQQGVVQLDQPIVTGEDNGLEVQIRCLEQGDLFHLSTARLTFIPVEVQSVKPTPEPDPPTRTRWERMLADDY